MSEKVPPDLIFSDQEIATYVVCPEAWRLKASQGWVMPKQNERMKESSNRRLDWVRSSDLATQLKRYGGVIYLMLVLVLITVLLLEQKRLTRLKQILPGLTQTSAPASQLPNEPSSLINPSSAEAR